MLDDILKERKRKLSSLRAREVDPYPAHTPPRTPLREIYDSFSYLAKRKVPVAIVGRVMGWRDQGNLIFADLQDFSGKIQAVFRKDNLKKDFISIIKPNIDIGDFVFVKGTPFITQKGEKSVEAKKFLILAKSLRPLPSQWYGLKDTEERLRRRYLDLLLGEKTMANAKMRIAVIRKIREFLVGEDFLEVETPILQPIPGGAQARPFITRHNALSEDFYLRIAPELYLKRLLVGGFEKIFEIGRVFRNEGIDRDHNPEFTMLELYWAYQDWQGLMKFSKEILSPFLPGKWGSIRYVEALRTIGKIKITEKDFETKIPRDEIDEMFKKKVRPLIMKPFFVTHYPIVISPLAKVDSQNPRLTERFQLIAGGTELANGFSELNDPVDQRERMKEQEKMYRGGDEEASRFDEDFLEALEYGMPPAAGLGIGIDRLVSLVTKSDNLKEVILFPTLRGRNKE